MNKHHEGTEATFRDRIGETRTLRRGRHGWQMKRARSTIVLELNAAAGPIVGSKIRAARIAKGMTLDALCTRAGIVAAVPKTRMWEIENSTRKEGVRLGTLYAIARALDVSIGSLMPSVEEVMSAAGADFVAQERLATNGG